jgi:hypothetical protein
MSFPILNTDVLRYTMCEFCTTPQLLRAFRLISRGTEAVYQYSKECVLQRMLGAGGLDPFVSVERGRGETWERSALRFLQTRRTFRPNVSEAWSISDLCDRMYSFGRVTMLPSACVACERRGTTKLKWRDEDPGPASTTSQFLKTIPIGVGGDVALHCTDSTCGHTVKFDTRLQSGCFHDSHARNSIHDPVLAPCSACSIPICGGCSTVCDSCGDAACSASPDCIDRCDLCDFTMCSACGETIVCTICKDAVCPACHHTSDMSLGTIEAATVCISCLERELL